MNEFGCKFTTNNSYTQKVGTLFNDFQVYPPPRCLPFAWGGNSPRLSRNIRILRGHKSLLLKTKDARTKRTPKQAICVIHCGRTDYTQTHPKVPYPLLSFASNGPVVCTKRACRLLQMSLSFVLFLTLICVISRVQMPSATESPDTNADLRCLQAFVQLPKTEKKSDKNL